MGHPSPRSVDGRHSNHLIGLDGLRGVAAVAVGILHAGLLTEVMPLPRAWLAVDFFWMLSGFVLALAYGDRLRRGWPLRFYMLARIARLYPMLALGAVLGAMATLAGNRPLAQALHGSGLVVAAIAAAVAVPVRLHGGVEPFPLNNPAWSLFFELIASLAFGLGLFRLRVRNLLIAVVALIVPYAVMAHSVGTNYGSHWPGFGFGFLRLALPFTIGILLHERWLAGRLPRLSLASWALWLALLLSFALPPLPRLDWAVTVVMIVLAYPAIITAALPTRSETAALTIAGVSADISYPLYLIHVPLLALSLPWLVRHGLSPAAAITLDLTVIAALALVIHRRLDAPLQSWLRDRLRRREQRYRSSCRAVGTAPAAPDQAAADRDLPVTRRPNAIPGNST